MKEKAVQINNNNDVSTKTFGWKRKDYYDYYYYHNQNKMKEKVGKINKKNKNIMNHNVSSEIFEKELQLLRELLR